MQASAFNLYIDNFPQAGRRLVHNTFSGAFVVLQDKPASVFEQVLSGQELGPDVRAVISAEQWTDADIGIVVESRAAERESHRAWFEAQRARRVLQAVVCINLSCNFECGYCCQADIMDGSVMSRATIEQTADWLAERARVIDAERVLIFAVGGEPLLYPERIKALCARLSSRIEPLGMDVGLGLISNGYYLSEDMVRELLPYGLESAQITLDGDRTTHACSRPSKRGEDTFQRIFDHVIAASRHIHIAVNGNYQAHNVAGFAPLIDELAAAGLGREHQIGFAPAFEMLSAPAGSVAGACNWSASPHGYRVALHDRILAAGYRTPPLEAVGPCGFHSHHLFAVDPQGNVFKCPGFLGHPDWRIGHVDSGLGERYEAFLRWDALDSCGDCAHRPNCAGGCVADATLKHGALQVQCEQGYLAEVAEHALPRAYLMATSDDRAAAIASFPAPPAALPQSSAESAPVRVVRSGALRVI
jgi:uncharacterized protein